MISEILLYSDWESNPDFRFRKPTFYPLNYQSILKIVLFGPRDVVARFCAAKVRNNFIIVGILAHNLHDYS